MIRLYIPTLAIATFLVATPVYAGTVEVVLTDVRADAGDLYVSLQTEDQFLKEDGIAGRIVANPQTGTVTVTLREVPDGRYSFTAWHDIDGDKRFSMGKMGPTDGWAMYKGGELRGMPTFAEQSFAVEGETVVREKMLYSDGRDR